MRTIIMLITLMAVPAVALSMPLDSSGPLPGPQEKDSPAYHIVSPSPPGQHEGIVTVTDIVKNYPPVRPHKPDVPSTGTVEEFSFSDLEPEDPSAGPFKKYYPKIPPDYSAREPFFHHQSIQQAPSLSLVFRGNRFSTDAGQPLEKAIGRADTDGKPHAMQRHLKSVFEPGAGGLFFT